MPDGRTYRVRLLFESLHIHIIIINTHLGLHSNERLAMSNQQTIVDVAQEKMKRITAQGINAQQTTTRPGRRRKGRASAAATTTTRKNV